MKVRDDFGHDCASCAGLCCIVPYFEKGSSFSFDKKANTPCGHLVIEDSAQRFKCGIWNSLEKDSCSGCIDFICGGSGNLTTELFEKLGLPKINILPYNMSQDEFDWLTANRANLFLFLRDWLLSFKHLEKESSVDKVILSKMVLDVLDSIEFLLKINLLSEVIDKELLEKLFIKAANNIKKNG